jgi:type I restriction enzyme S subunit
MSEVKRNVPKLRFSGFSDDWKEVLLGELGVFNGGGTPSTSNSSFWQGSIPWISSSDVNENDINKLNVTRFITDEAVKDSATKMIPKNSVLFVSRVGVGKLAINKNAVCTSQDFTNLSLSEDNSHFVGYLFLSKPNLLKRYSQGTSIKGFTIKDISTLKVLRPVLLEQNKIADFLSSADKKIEQLAEKHRLLTEYKKGVMQQLFSQEIRFKDEEGNSYPEWKENLLGDFSFITTGSSNREDSGLVGEFTFFDRSQDIRTSDRYLFDGEAVIVAGEGQDFIPKYFIGKFDLHQRAYAVMDFKKSSGRFLFYSLLFYKNYFLSQAVGSTVKSLRLPMFKKMPLLMPCLEEQQKIASFLTEIDQKIDQAWSILEQTKSFKKGLLQKMFV